jgi:hypothetical protein
MTAENVPRELRVLSALIERRYRIPFGLKALYVLVRYAKAKMRPRLPQLRIRLIAPVRYDAQSLRDAQGSRLSFPLLIGLVPRFSLPVQS